MRNTLTLVAVLRKIDDDFPTLSEGQVSVYQRIEVSERFVRNCLLYVLFSLSIIWALLACVYGERASGIVVVLRVFCGLRVNNWAIMFLIYSSEVLLN